MTKWRLGLAVTRGLTRRQIGSKACLIEGAFFSSEHRLAGRGFLTSDCVESARGTGRANRQLWGPGVGRAGHRDVCAVVANGGLG